MLLIEFAGIPGSGKSHVAEKLRAWLAASGISYVDVAEFLLKEGARTPDALPHRRRKIDLGSKDADVLLKSFRHFHLAEPEYTLKYLHAVIELETSTSVRDLILSSFNYCCAQRGFFLTRRDRINARLIIQEEGLVHRLFTLFGYRCSDSRDERVLEQLAESTPPPHILIWPRCAPTIAIERLGRRNRKTPDRLAGMSSQEATEILASGERKLETAVSILRKRGTRVAEVRTDENFDAAAVFGALFCDVSDLNISPH